MSTIMHWPQQIPIDLLNGLLWSSSRVSVHLSSSFGQILRATLPVFEIAHLVLTNSKLALSIMWPKEHLPWRIISKVGWQCKAWQVHVLYRHHNVSVPIWDGTLHHSVSSFGCLRYLYTVSEFNTSKLSVLTVAWLSESIATFAILLSKLFFI